MKNLGQSVYAHCELDREKAVGTYYGTRVAELPPTQTRHPTSSFSSGRDSHASDDSNSGHDQHW